MVYLNLVQFLGRKCLFSKAHNVRLFIKSRVNISVLNSVRCRAYSLNATVLKPNVSRFSVCLSKPCNNKILASYYFKAPFKICRPIHTSEQRYLHPVVWGILRPVFKLVAVLTGRAFRKWWRNLPPNKKQYFLQVIKENRYKIAIFILICAGWSVTYYLQHIEETPITKRKRFIAFNSKQLKKINEYELEQISHELQKDKVPDNHPYVIRVQNIVNRILIANKDIEEIKDKNWGVSVINSSIENAFVLPIGHVFVFSGMLALCSNDDELGGILAHEIAHCIMNHGAEKVSLGHLIDLISIGIIAAIWALIPSDSLSLISHWVYHNFVKVIFELPYNRKIETEADTVGLQLAAKACFDVRESSAFWAKMALLHNYGGAPPDIEFLSTHPSHEKRSEYLDSIMDQAIATRYECGCPNLKRADPRQNIHVVAKAIDAARKKLLLQNPKPVIHIRI